MQIQLFLHVCFPAVLGTQPDALPYKCGIPKHVNMCLQYVLMCPGKDADLLSSQSLGLFVSLGLMQRM